jgi:hypothetical protein
MVILITLMAKVVINIFGEIRTAYIFLSKDLPTNIIMIKNR